MKEKCFFQCASFQHKERLKTRLEPEFLLMGLWKHEGMRVRPSHLMMVKENEEKKNIGDLSEASKSR